MVPIEDIPKLVHEGKLETVAAEDIERKYEQFRQGIHRRLRKTLTLSRELASELSYLEQEAASVLVDGFIEELKEKYSGALVSEYLEEVRHSLLDNLETLQERKVRGAGRRWSSPGRQFTHARAPERDPFRVYGVNVLLAHNDEDGSPVIFETTPTLHESFRHDPAQLATRAAAGIQISWTCARVPSFRAEADSWSCTPTTPSPKRECGALSSAC